MTHFIKHLSNKSSKLFLRSLCRSYHDIDVSTTGVIRRVVVKSEARQGNSIQRKGTELKYKCFDYTYTQRITKSVHRYIHLIENRWRFNMAEEATSDISLPKCVRGMKILDQQKFSVMYKVPTLKLPISSIKLVMKNNKGLKLFKRPGIRTLVDLDDNDQKKSHKILLLSPTNYTSRESFNEEEKQYLSKANIDMESLSFKDIEVGYDNWTYAEILQAILPPEGDGVAGFSQIGHIIHLNLKDEHLPYREIIAQVLLDKVKTAKTIVNKINTIDNTFRNFQMEVLAGEENFITETKENGVKFELDFSKVYWNPRLSTEHERMISKLKTKDVVYDMFAGIGPFAVPAAKKSCIVFANDLNPESHKWLEHNIKINKVKGDIQTFNKDGRDFASNVIKQDLMKRWTCSQDEKFSLHIIMNLPALAIEFLDVFVGLMNDVDKSQITKYVPPLVNCYCFTKCDNKEDDVRVQVEQVLDHKLGSSASVRHVRKVAPNKDMMCITFPLSEEILFSVEKTSEPPEKKLKSNTGTESS